MILKDVFYFCQSVQFTIKFPTEMVFFITNLISTKSALYNQANREIIHQIKTG